MRLLTHRCPQVACRHEDVACLIRQALVRGVRLGALRDVHEECRKRPLRHGSERREHRRRCDARVRKVAQRHRRPATRGAAPLHLQHRIHKRQPCERQRTRIQHTRADDRRECLPQRLGRHAQRVVLHHRVRVDVVVEVVARRRRDQRRRLERDNVQRIAMGHRRRQRRLRRGCRQRHDNPRTAEQIHQLRAGLPVHVHVVVGHERRKDVRELLHGLGRIRTPAVGAHASLNHQCKHLGQHRFLPQARRPVGLRASLGHRLLRDRICLPAERLRLRRQLPHQLQTHLLHRLELRHVARGQRSAHRIGQRRAHVHKARARRRDRQQHQVAEQDADRQMAVPLGALQQQRNHQRRERRRP